MTELQDFLIRKAVDDLLKKRIVLKLYYDIVDGILCQDIELGNIWENYNKYLLEYKKGEK